MVRVFMVRVMHFVFGVLLCVLVGVPAGAEDPPKKLTPQERQEQEARWKELSAAGIKAYRAGQRAEAVKAAESALELARQLYPKTEFPDGHEYLVASLNNLAFLSTAQGKYAAAEALYAESLEMRKRLRKGDHIELVVALNSLAGTYRVQGKYARAEPLLKDALDMIRRLHTGDHPDVATGLNNLGHLYFSQERYAAAEPLFKDALDMYKRLFKGDHPSVAVAMNNVGGLYRVQGKYAEAEPFVKDALDMHKRLYKGDHPSVVTDLNNLGILYKSQGKYAQAEILYKDSLDMGRRLFPKDHPDHVRGLTNLAVLYDTQGKFTEAEPLYKEALAISRRLFTGDHPDVAGGMNNLASLYKSLGKYTEAEPLYRDALEMRKRMFKGDHSAVASGLNNLSQFYVSVGKFAEAEPLAVAALEMRNRLFKDDHPERAQSLNNLGLLYFAQERFADAEPRFKDALEMRKRLFKGDHPDLALSLSTLAAFYRSQRRYAEAEPLDKDSLAMYRRLFKGDHPHVAATGTGLAELYQWQGRYAEAEPLFKDALEMRKRLFKGDHPDVAYSLTDLGFLYWSLGKYADAEEQYRAALGMYQRLVVGFAQEKSEGEVLTLLARHPLVRDAFLSNELTRGADPATVYPRLWAEKGNIARVYERRQQQARAATDPTVTAKLAELADARRRRAELIYAPATSDPATLADRGERIKRHERRIDELARDLTKRLPLLARAERLAAARPADLQKVLPADTAVVDFWRFVRFEQDRTKPGKAGERQTTRYLAFVVTRDTIAWVDLDTAANVEPAITAWRDAITSGKEIPLAVPAKVRELVWEPVRKQLPAGTKTVYICPDQALCKVPFAALPGDRAGTVLLEDYALATIPHASLLLDKLLPQDPLKNPPSDALVVGGVKYDTDVATGGAAFAAPLVKPDAKLGWSFLANTVGEANGVSVAAEKKKIAATRLEGAKATPATVLSALPKAKYAHLATHGFFADPSFRSVFQLDPKDYETRGGERIGRAANSPLVMTGLVFAGANNPQTPGRGIVTGEALIDLDLSGLELAVLSACETGLGDVAGGEGTFGLQRAFHYAGTANVVASLWKVPDAPTAALMALFYANLWDKNHSPMEALRQAQLELYKNPQKIPELAKGFRGQFKEVAGTDIEVKPAKDGRAHPLLWAAFTLSGPGR